MRYLVISDLHGSLKYSEMAISKFSQYDCKKIIILGDILYHGPRNDLPEEYNPKGVIKLLNPLKDKILAIRGNCEAEVDEMVLDFPIFPEALVEFPFGKCLLTHGHHLDECDFDGYIMHGHTHINKIEGNIINVGSTSIPKDTYHSYAIIDDTVITIYNLLDDSVIISKDLKR